MTNAREIELGELMPQEGRSSVNPADYPGEVFELLSIPAYDRGSAEIALGSEIGSTKQAVHPGDVLLSKIVPHIRRAWVVEPSAGSRQIASSEWIVFRSKEADARYLRHFLVSDGFHRQFMQTVSGVGGSLLRARPKYVAKIKIPLPPLEEQRRIAAILDKAGSLKDQDRLREKSLSSFEDSLFRHFFGGIADQVNRWHWQKFGDLCSRLTVGVVVKPASYYCENGVPALRSFNVKAGAISEENLVFISDRDNNGALAKSRLATGDLVFVRSGRPGTCAVIPPGLDGCNAIDLLLATVDQSRILPEFVSSYFNSHGGRASILSESRGQIQQHFNAGSLVKASIPVPPVTLQQEFCAVLNQKRLQAKRCDSSVAALGRLSSALSSEFFGGS
jgi:type I restriction enzyme S subunit